MKMYVELDRVDRARELRQHGSLIAGASADFENFLGARQFGDLAHQGDHVRL